MNASVAAAAVALCLLQAWGAWALFFKRWDVATWVALACPLAVLALCIGRMSFDGPLSLWRGLRPLEQVFLAGNVLLALAAAGLLLGRVGAASATGWLLWVFNTASCAVMVYLAFFFRLF